MSMNILHYYIFWPLIFFVSTMVSFCRVSVAWDKLIAYSATHTEEADSS